MEHVILKEKFASYRKGTIFAIVEHRSVWMADVNHDLPRWVSDGKWIGPFEFGMKRSPYTEYCITERGYKNNQELFEKYHPI